MTAGNGAQVPLPAAAHPVGNPPQGTATRESLEEAVIRAALGFHPRPAVDLYKCASDLGVVEVRTAERVDGYTDFTGPAPIIYLSQAANPARMRFTFAHELAHVMVRTNDCERAGGHKLATARQLDEERLADRIAASLLVPKDWVRALAEAGITWPHLHRMCMTARVSHSMLVTRLSAEGYPTGLLRWRRGPHGWILMSRPGAPKYLHGRVELGQACQAVIDETAAGLTEVTLDLDVRGERMLLPGSLRRNGDNASLLFNSTHLRRDRASAQPLT